MELKKMILTCFLLFILLAPQEMVSARICFKEVGICPRPRWPCRHVCYIFHEAAGNCVRRLFNLTHDRNSYCVCMWFAERCE
ncbi:hypothetical protein AXF42_Ash003438 [Apostasia shenzhenica]|uniref:Uncharacterized protein n=1 Tax=Apostasia shenzhenica TaxID=1088818 RepID=A0A2I0BG87_9ASPA|nr:hypothetical protein AXF42_Ash003438 [Apostasia shenzhenica]